MRHTWRSSRVDQNRAAADEQAASFTKRTEEVLGAVYFLYQTDNRVPVRKSSHDGFLEFTSYRNNFLVLFLIVNMSSCIPTFDALTRNAILVPLPLSWLTKCPYEKTSPKPSRSAWFPFARCHRQEDNARRDLLQFLGASREKRIFFVTSIDEFIWRRKYGMLYYYKCTLTYNGGEQIIFLDSLSLSELFMYQSRVQQLIHSNQICLNRTFKKMVKS